MDILFIILESFRVSSVGCCIAQGVSRFISVSQLHAHVWSNLSRHFCDIFWTRYKSNLEPFWSLFEL